MPANSSAICSATDGPYKPKYDTVDQLEDLFENVRSWAEQVDDAVGVMEASRTIYLEAGVSVPARCTYTGQGLQSPERRVSISK